MQESSVLALVPFSVGFNLDLQRTYQVRIRYLGTGTAVRTYVVLAYVVLSLYEYDRMITVPPTVHCTQQQQS